MFTYPIGLLQKAKKLEFFDWWTVDSPGFTHSVTIIGTAGEKLYIDWGDSSAIETIVFTGAAQTITHVYAVGLFTQRWSVNKLAVTRLDTNRDLTGAIPIALQGFYNMTRLSLLLDGLTGDLSTDGWPEAFALWSQFDYFDVAINSFSGDLETWIPVINVWKNTLRFLRLSDNGFTGDLSLWNFTGGSSFRNIYLQNNSFTGDLSLWDLSGYNMAIFRTDGNSFTGDLTYIGLENWTLLSNYYVSSNSFTGLNNNVNTLFVNRVIYTGTSKFCYLQNNAESLTGVYQQPDIGTYSGGINDLTETEITNLSVGLDYDGLGSNVAWSTLEKVWVLENLAVSSVNATLRYAFSFLYDAITSTIKVKNSGALGSEYTDFDFSNSGGASTTDWINPTNGLAEDWTDNTPGSYTYEIITGEGFVGNAQKATKLVPQISGRSFVSDPINITNGNRYKLVMSYKGVFAGAELINVINSSNGTQVSLSLADNTGDAVEVESNIFSANDSQAKLLIVLSNTNDWIIIDNARLVEIVGADDWLNPVNGLAEYWAVDSGTPTTTIITGEGFVGNAQKVESTGALVGIITTSVINGSLSGGLGIKYKTDSANLVVHLRFYDSLDVFQGEIQIPLAANILDAISVVIPYTYSGNVGDYLKEIVVYNSGATYFIIDELEIVEL